jgi:hypothetical protein
MKIKAEVIAVETNGNSITVRMQGNQIGASAAWRMEVQEIHISASKTNSRAFYIGRSVEIEVKPR